MKSSDWDEIEKEIDAEYPGLLEIYRWFHAHPELTGREAVTASTLGAALAEAGCEVTGGVGGHGVVGLLGNGEGPVVMLRADMDALPVKEETGLPYASTVTGTDSAGRQVGVMHACGHDAHMAILVGAARVLAAFREHWHGTVLFIGQPAEETVSGAKAMIRDGLFSRFPRPGSALALHLGPGIRAGDIGFRDGAFSAGAESLDLVVRGTGGHAAHPELAKDPVVAAAEIVLALQTVVSREVRPGEFAVLTVAAIHGGAKHNAIPDEVALQINLRYYREEVRRHLLEAVPRVAEGIARAAGIPEDRTPLVTVLDESVPPLYNDPGLTQRVMAACRKRLGESHVHEIEPLAGSEDFGIFGTVEPGIPLCYFRIGADPPGGEGQGPYLHSGRFSPDPGAIRTGVAAMVAAVLELLG